MCPMSAQVWETSTLHSSAQNVVFTLSGFSTFYTKSLIFIFFTSDFQFPVIYLIDKIYKT